MKHAVPGRFGRRVAVAALAVLASLGVRGQTAPSPAPSDAGAPPAPPPVVSRISKFFYPHEKDGKRIAVAEGEWAILRGQDEVDLVQPCITLYRDVEGSPQREKVVLRGATGLFNQKTHHARLEGQVTVQQEDGTELRTDHINLDILQKRLTTEGRVEFLKPGLALTGTGLEASEILNVLVLRSGIILSVRGNAVGLFKGAGAAPAAPPAGGGAAVETNLTCEGPATMSKLASPRPETGATEELRLARGVVVTRHDAAGLMRLTGDAATLELYHGPATAGAAPSAPGADPGRVTEVRRAVLTGGVQLVEGQGLSGNAQRLVWTAADDRLELEHESGVRLVRSSFSLKGRSVVVMRRDARTVCRTDAQMTFIPEAGPAEQNRPASGQPWIVGADTLEVRLQADLKGLDAVDAAGHVTISGEAGAPGGAAGAAARQTASGDRFVWEGAARRGVLQGTPVSLRQGDHRMEAAQVVFFPLDQRVVLQGPKRIELAPQAVAAPAAGTPPAAPAEGRIVVSSSGDIALDTAGGTVDIGDGAWVLSPQTRLEADRLRFRLAPGGGGVERALGWGHIHVSDRANGADIFGDHLAWDVRSQEFQVEGVPFAYIVQRGGRLQGQAITVSRQPDGLRCANRSGQKGRIQIETPEAKRAGP